MTHFANSNALLMMAETMDHSYCISTLLDSHLLQKEDMVLYPNQLESAEQPSWPLSELSQDIMSFIDDWSINITSTAPIAEQLPAAPDVELQHPNCPPDVPMQEYTSQASNYEVIKDAKLCDMLRHSRCDNGAVQGDRSCSKSSACRSLPTELSFSDKKRPRRPLIRHKNRTISPAKAHRPLNCSSSADDNIGCDELFIEGNCGPPHEKPVSKNLVAERMRRQKLNEKLFSLRAIVPKISKMNKASIVQDAIEYVKHLEMQVDARHNDISLLQSRAQSIRAAMASCKGLFHNQLTEHDILKLDIVRVEDNIFHLKVECRKGDGAFVQITRALEALQLRILSANLAAVDDHLLNTIVFQVEPRKIQRNEDLRDMIIAIFSKFGLRETKERN